MQIYRFYVLTSSDDPTNIRYVGTTTKTIKQRLSGHKYNATHPNKRVQPIHKWMWSKIEKGFTINIKEIDQCDESLWEATEQKWIKYYKDLGYKLLNISKGGVGVITKEMREISGIERSIKAHEIPIYALDDNKNIVYKFNSVKEAVKFFNLKGRTAISNALKGRTPKSCGYYWVYKKDYDLGNIRIDEYTKKKAYLEKTCIKVYKFDVNGNLIKTYNSLADCWKNEGFYESGLRPAIKNKKLFHNYYWSSSPNINIQEYNNINFPYVQIDQNGNQIQRYKTYKEIGIKYSLSESTVLEKIKNNKCFSDNTKIIKIKI